MNTNAQEQITVNPSDSRQESTRWRRFIAWCRRIAEHLWYGLASLFRIFFAKQQDRYWAIIFAMAVVAWLYLLLSAIFRPSNWLTVALVFATVFMIVLYLVHLLNNQNPDTTAEKKASVFVKITLEAFIAVVFAFFLVQAGFIPDTSPSENFIIAFVVAITLLSLQIVAGAAGIAESFNIAVKTVEDLSKRSKNSANRISDAAVEIEKIRNEIHIVSTEARNIALMSNLLEINRRHLDPMTEAMCSAVESAVDTMKSWNKKGEDLIDSGNKQTVQSESWWRLMETYNREERYDIARDEVVTNVRNYAFLILRLIKEHIAAVNEDGNEYHGKRVIVAQVTPFAPKDFYNFPNGSSNNRYYFDQEFFGTYRRLLSHYLRHDDVDVKRIILCAQDPGTVEENRDLGWTLDDPLKLYFGCKRMNVLPTSIPIAASKHQSQNTDKLLAAQFDEHDPAKRLRENVVDYPWVPVYPNPSGEKLDVPDKFKPGCVRLEEKQNIYSVRVQNKHLKKHGGDDTQGANLDALFGKAEMMKDLAWDVLDKEVADKKKRLGRLNTLWEQLNKATICCAKMLLGQNSTSQDLCLFEIVPVVQEIDALLANKSEMKQSASGQPMGDAEKWLYWWLVCLEQETYAKPISELLPTVWKRFKSDVLAINPGEDISKKECLRLVPLRSRKKTNANWIKRDFAYIEENGILPEFVLIGLANDRSSKMNDVRWTVFFGSEMSEPFHAARIRFDFGDAGGRNGGLGQEKGLLEKHQEWLSALWVQSSVKNVTNNFIKAMEADDDEHLMDFLNSVVDLQ